MGKIKEYYHDEIERLFNNQDGPDEDELHAMLREPLHNPSDGPRTECERHANSHKHEPTPF